MDAWAIGFDLQKYFSTRLKRSEIVNCIMQISALKHFEKLKQKRDMKIYIISLIFLIFQSVPHIVREVCVIMKQATVMSVRMDIMGSSVWMVCKQ